MAPWGGGGEAGGGSGQGATVHDYAPPLGAKIRPNTALMFDVTGAEVVAIVISAFYPDTGASEIVYDRTGFSKNFRPSVGILGLGTFIGSERHPISGGFHFILRRRGGWPRSPDIRIEGGTIEGGVITG